MTDLNKRWRWITLAGTFTAAIFIFLLAFKPWEGQAKAMTEEAVKEAILAQYSGKVNESIKKGNRYRLELETEQGVYEVEVSAYSGEILALHRLKSWVTTKPASPSPTGNPLSPTLTPNPANTNGGSLSPSATPKPSQKPEATSPVSTAKPSSKPTDNVKLIGEEQAGKLAAGHVKGKVEEIDLKTAKDGKAYYLVEVDVKNRGDAIVQVNAISGAIMSVVWEDDDDNED